VSSGVASPHNFGKAKIFDFREITLFCLEKRLSKHKMAIFSKHFGGHGPFGSPVATPIFVNPGVDFRCPHWLESVPFYLH